jgi:thiol-disulfide isomerase/thioredoxin
MRQLLILLFFLWCSRGATAQVTLTIIQSGLKGDSVPAYQLVDYEDAKYTALNDSTRAYTLNIKNPGSLFIGIDPGTGWFSRIWIDPKIKRKELTIDYSAKKTRVKNPDKDDLLFEKVFSYHKSSDRREPDSIMIAYVKKHPDSYLSLYFVSHGLYRNEPEKKIAAFKLLGEKFKDHPDYIRTKASLFERKYPMPGDPFKEFSLNDINDKTFNSSSITSKYILLHFWSNGCKPCIKEMDSLVRLYNSLDTSKVAFISVGMDDKRENWKNSKTTAKIKWPNVWQPGGGVGDLCLHYNVNAMPFFILFNNQKEIVSIKYGADELDNIKETMISSGLNRVVH